MLTNTKKTPRFAWVFSVLGHARILHVMKHPDTIHFLGIGAQKAGTTFLWGLLRQHPEICASDVKELGFFEQTDTHKPESREKYLSHFMWNEQVQRVAGEVTPRYLYIKKAPERIAAAFPQIKLIVVVRNPIDRIQSAYFMSLRNNIRSKYMFTRDYFWKQITRRHDLLGMGYYAEQIENYLQYFDREQILILFFEDLITDPVSTAQRVYEFLALVDVSFIPEIDKEYVNPALVPTKHLFLFKIRQLTVRLSRWFHIHHHPIIKFFLETVLPLHRFNRRAATREEKTILIAEDRKKLRKYYERDIKRLEKITGRNLDHWV